MIQNHPLDFPKTHNSQPSKMPSAPSENVSLMVNPVSQCAAISFITP